MLALTAGERCTFVARSGDRLVGCTCRGNNRSLDDYLLDLTGGRPAAAASDDDRADPPIVAITAAR